MKYKIWDIVWIKWPTYTFISPILYIRNYWWNNGIVYWVHELWWVMEEDISWKVDSVWNIIF